MAQGLQRKLLVVLDAGKLSLDSAIIHLHMHGSACGAVGVPGDRRSRGGLRTKRHALVANDRVMLIIALSSSQRYDAPCGRELLRRLSPSRGRPHLVMDRA